MLSTGCPYEAPQVRHRAVMVQVHGENRSALKKKKKKQAHPESSQMSLSIQGLGDSLVAQQTG